MAVGTVNRDEIRAADLAEPIAYGRPVHRKRDKFSIWTQGRRKEAVFCSPKGVDNQFCGMCLYVDYNDLSEQLGRCRGDLRLACELIGYPGVQDGNRRFPTRGELRPARLGARDRRRLERKFLGANAGRQNSANDSVVAEPFIEGLGIG